MLLCLFPAQIEEGRQGKNEDKDNRKSCKHTVVIHQPISGVSDLGNGIRNTAAPAVLARIVTCQGLRGLFRIAQLGWDCELRRSGHGRMPAACRRSIGCPVISLGAPGPDSGTLGKPQTLSRLMPVDNETLHPKNGQPVRGSPGRAVVTHSAKGPVSRILSCAVIPLGAALPRTLISDLPGGFGHCMEPTCDRHRRRKVPLEPPERIGPIRSAAWLLAAASLPIWSCSVWGLPCPRPHSRSGALLPHHFTLTPARTGSPGEPFKPFRVALLRGVAEAVSFLWHWPSVNLKAHIPDVIRHTALRSSDFPPPKARVGKTSAATARSSCHLKCTPSRRSNLNSTSGPRTPPGTITTCSA